jgi:hypothetical protein
MGPWPRLPAWLQRLLSRENVMALVLCLIVVGVLIVTADSAPQWIYQGF